jgi:hypothetical protein
MNPSMLLQLIGDTGVSILAGLWAIAIVAVLGGWLHVSWRRFLWPAICSFGNWLGRP